MPMWLILAVAVFWVGFPLVALGYGAWRELKADREAQELERRASERFGRPVSIEQHGGLRATDVDKAFEMHRLNPHRNGH